MVTRFYEPRNQLTLQARQSGNLPFSFGGFSLMFFYLRRCQSWHLKLCRKTTTKGTGTFVVVLGWTSYSLKRVAMAACTMPALMR